MKSIFRRWFGSRRTFLKQIMASGGAMTVAALARPAAAEPQAPAAEPAADTAQGYRLTPHIRTYYEKADL